MKAKNSRSGATNIPPTKSPIIAASRATRGGVSGRTRMASTQRPAMSSVTVAAVCASVVGRSWAREIAYETSVQAATTAPVGIVKRSTRARKPGTYRRVFGPSATKKPGMPIVSASIAVKCRGRNG